MFETFTNEPVDIGALPKYEEVVLRKPHADYWKIICINLFVFFGSLAIAIGLLLFFVDDFRTFTTPIIIGYLVILICSVLLFYVGFSKRGYAIRAKDVIYKSGIVAESTTIVPLNRIQHIELNENILSRLYHLGSLQIFTAGGHTGHLNISGIPIAEAKSIRDLLLQKLNQVENPAANSED